MYNILDLSAVALHCLHTGKEIGAIKTASGREINSPMHAVQVFSERYLPNILPFGTVIAVVDGGSEYRKSIDPEYKAGRESDPEVRQLFQESIEAIRDLLLHLGANICSLGGQEADDVIAYLCQNLKGHKYVHTLDRDLVSLTALDVTVSIKQQIVDEFVDKGVAVETKYITLYKSLVGDTSDNIKGIKGFGPKTWESLVEIVNMDDLLAIAEFTASKFDVKPDFSSMPEYQRLEALAEGNKVVRMILDNLKSTTAEKTIVNGVQRNVVKHGSWVTSYKLAKLAPHKVDELISSNVFRRLKWDKRVPNLEAIENVLKNTRQGFVEFAQEFVKYMPTQHLVTRKHIRPDTIQKLVSSFRQSRFLALDWETWAEPNENFKEAARGDFVDMIGSKISGMGITYGENLERTMYFQFDHADEENNISKDFLRELLFAIPEDLPIVIHNTYFECSVLLSEFGVQFESPHDTKIMHCHIDEMESSGLKDLSARYLKYRQATYSDTIAKGKTMKDYTGAEVFKYGADDPLVTALLYDLFKIILEVEGTWDFIKNYEFPTVNLLAEAHVKGVSIDWEAVERQRDEDIQAGKNCVNKMRELLSSNNNPVEHGLAAERWYKEEYEPIYDAQLKALKQDLSKLTEVTRDFFTAPALRFLEKIEGNPIENLFDVYETVPVEDAEEFLDNQFRHRRKDTINKLAQSYGYSDWEESTNAIKFSFAANKINLIAKSLGLNVQAKASLWGEFISKAEAVAKTAEQKKFIHAVKEVSDGQKNGEGYKLLKNMFDALGETKTKGVGMELNINSPKQLQSLLYGTLNLPILIRDFKISDARRASGIETGTPQANETAFKEAMASPEAKGWKADVIKNLLDAKKSDTRVKLFYSKFPLWKHPKDGLIHPQFNSVGTESRRPSGSAPNMLQLSKKGDGLKVRECIIPNQAMGHDLIVAIDFDGQELRVMAGLSGDTNLLSCYVGDNLKDAHSIVAATIMNCSYEDFVKNRKSSDEKVAKKYDDVRKLAKGVNFASAYGCGKAKLAQMLSIEEAEAEKYLDAKKAVYSGLEDWKVKVQEELNRKGFVKTLLGSRKHVYDRLGDRELKSYYERSAVNFLVQGLCADYLKFVLATLWKRRTFERHNAVLVAPIYDEVVFSCHSSQAVSLIKEVNAVMQIGIPGLPVKLLTNPSLGVNFGNQIEVLKDCNQELTDELIQIAIKSALGN